MANVQVYGNWGDYMSISTVSRAIVKRLQQRSVPLSIWTAGSFTSIYKEVKGKIRLNSRAPIGIYIGYPPAAIGYLQGHKTKILITVCETTKVPVEWVDVCNTMTYVFVPSAFCKQSFIDSGVPYNKIAILNHGVSREMFWQEKPLKTFSKIQLLHVSGAISFPQRKGTPQLLTAFAELVKNHNPDVQLNLKMFENEQLRKALKYLDIEKNVTILPNESLNPVEMGKLLLSMDAVVQPSRGEGFGIVPLEARCLGIPCALTAVTGHIDHFAPGVDVEIKTGPYQMMDTQGNQDGAAPSLSPVHVYDGLIDLIDNLPMHKANTELWASKFAPMWLWDKVLLPLTKVVIPLSKKRNQATRLGESTGLLGY